MSKPKKQIFDYDDPVQNQENHPLGYSWKHLALVVNLFFGVLALVMLYLFFFGHLNTNGRIVCGVFPIYLIGMLFFINRSKKHLMIGLAINAGLFILFWLAFRFL